MKTKKQTKKVSLGITHISCDEMIPGIRTAGRRTVIDAKKVAVLFEGKEVLLADVLRSMKKTGVTVAPKVKSNP